MASHQVLFLSTRSSSSFLNLHFNLCFYLSRAYHRNETRDFTSVPLKYLIGLIRKLNTSHVYCFNVESHELGKVPLSVLFTHFSYQFSELNHM